MDFTHDANDLQYCKKNKQKNKQNEGFPQHVPSSVDWTLHLTVTLHLSVLKAYGHILTGLT